MAALALVLVAGGLFLRRERVPPNRRALAAGTAAAVLYALFFAGVLTAARKTAFGPEGSLPALRPVFETIDRGAAAAVLFMKNRGEVLFGIGGAALFLAAVAAAAARRRRAGGFLFLALALALALSAENRLSDGLGREGFIRYLLAAGAVLVAGLFPGPAEPGRGKRGGMYAAGLGALLLAATAAGFYRIDSQPRFDEFEATNALVGVQLLEGDPDTTDFIWTYFPRSYGADSCSSALFTVPAAEMMRLFGVHLVAFRSISVLWGMAAIALLYLLGARLFSPGAGLLAAALFAISPWHMTIFRAGMFGSMSIAFALLVFNLFFTAIRSQRILPYLFLGFVLSFYGFCYLPVKIVLPMLLALWVARAALRRGFFRRNLPGFLVFLAVFAVFFSIQAGSLGMIADTAYKSSKGGSIYPFIGSESRADMSMRWELVPGQLLTNLEDLYLNLCVDRWSGSFTYPPKGGLVNRAVFLPAVLGLAWALYHWKRTRYLFLVLWIAPATVPFMALVKPIGSPPRHLILGIPLICLAAAVFITALGSRFLGLFPGKTRRVGISLGAAAVVLYLLPLTVLNVSRYFAMKEPDSNAVGLFVADLFRRGRRTEVHFESFYTTLGPARAIDFLCYPETGRLYRYHTDIHRYYDYHEIAAHPLCAYFAGTAGLADSLVRASRGSEPGAVVVHPPNRKALEAAVESTGARGALGEIRDRWGDEIVGYYFLPESGGAIDTAPEPGI